MANPYLLDAEAALMIEILTEYAEVDRELCEGIVQLAISNKKDNHLFYLKLIIEDFMSNLQHNVPENIN